MVPGQLNIIYQWFKKRPLTIALSLILKFAFFSTEEVAFFIGHVLFLKSQPLLELLAESSATTLVIEVSEVPLRL